MTNIKERTNYFGWLGFLSALMLLALIAWIYELRTGLGVTGMRDVISWGVYIFTFTFFVKLSAGGLIVASAAEVFNIEGLKPLARLGVLVAAVSVFIAAATIIPDLGRPDRIFNLFFHSNWSSPVMWDITIIICYFLLAVAELWLMSHDGDSPRRQKQFKVLAFIGLPAAFTLHSITAWIFGLQIARPFWNTALMAPLFVVSAILSGTALIAVIVWALQRFAGAKVSAVTWSKLSGLMAITLAIDLFFVLCEYITIRWGQVPAEMAALKMILPGGQHSTLFWLEWVIGGIIPFLLLVIPSTRKRVEMVAAAALLIMIGVYSFQIGLSVVGMANPLIQLAPGISLGTYAPGLSVFQFVGQYVPTWVEYVIALGVIAWAAMLVTLGYRWLGVDKSMSQLGQAD